MRTAVHIWKSLCQWEFLASRLGKSRSGGCSGSGHREGLAGGPGEGLAPREPEQGGGTASTPLSQELWDQTPLPGEHK